MPPGPDAEARAEAFFEGLLGLPRVAKPAELAVRGGCWFERGQVKVHLGVEEDFRPARKAHPALVVADLDALCGLLDVRPPDPAHRGRPGAAPVVRGRPVRQPDRAGPRVGDGLRAEGRPRRPARPRAPRW